MGSPIGNHRTLGPGNPLVFQPTPIVIKAEHLAISRIAPDLHG